MWKALKSNILNITGCLILSVVIVCTVLILPSIVFNKYALILIIYNTASRTSGIVDQEFNSMEQCKMVHKEIVSNNEFPYQQYFTVKGGCYKV